MMLLVNILVKDTVVQTPMEPVVPSILHDEEKSQLEQDLGNRGERNGKTHADFGTDWVEEPDRQSLNHEMGNENRLHAFPLFLVAWNLGILNLVLLEVGDAVNNEPRQTTAKVHDFVHEEEKETGGENIVIHPVVVSTPYFLKGV